MEKVGLSSKVNLKQTHAYLGKVIKVVFTSGDDPVKVLVKHPNGTDTAYYAISDVYVRTFDANAPIDQQYTQDGRKVLHLFRSGYPPKGPLTVWIDGLTNVQSYPDDGQCVNLSLQLVTRPREEALYVCFTAIYGMPAYERGSHDDPKYRTTSTMAYESQDVCEAHIAFTSPFWTIIKTTYGPNDGSYTSVTVKTKTNIKA